MDIAITESGMMANRMDDYISRQAAIDGILQFMPVEVRNNASMAEQVNYVAWKTAISCAESFVRTMPSAQPKRKTARMEKQMSDLISREWLIEAVEEGWIKFDTQEDYNRIIHLVRDIAPSAQPEIIRCKECIHNPKESWFGCPMSHLSEEQRPETAWCWKGERKDGNV